MIPCRAKAVEGGVFVEANTPFGKKEMTLSCNQEQFMLGITSYKGGSMMQDAFYFLTADEREFLISGTTPEEWAKMFPPEDDVDG